MTLCLWTLFAIKIDIDFVRYIRELPGASSGASNETSSALVAKFQARPERSTCRRRHASTAQASSSNPGTSTDRRRHTYVSSRTQVPGFPRVCKAWPQTFHRARGTPAYMASACKNQCACAHACVRCVQGRTTAVARSSSYA